LTVGALLGEHPNSLDESALLARDWLIQLKGAVRLAKTQHVRICN
jgi:hypothetical protein